MTSVRIKNFGVVSVGTCVWKGWLERDLKLCVLCEKDTSGRAKNVRTGKIAPLCLECAKRRGLA